MSDLPPRPPWLCRAGWHRMVVTTAGPSDLLLEALDGSPVIELQEACTRCPARRERHLPLTRVPRRAWSR